MVDGSLSETVLAAVAAIPRGKVMSYGDVAEYVGTRAARNVGRILAQSDGEWAGGTLPWHRVLRADGSCAPHLRDEQQQRLRAEGVPFTRRGKVDMSTARWDGRPPSPRKARNAGSRA